MSETPPHRVLAEFYDTERYDVVYNQYEALDASWKEIIEAGVQSLSTDAAPASEADSPTEQPSQS